MKHATFLLVLAVWALVSGVRAEEPGSERLRDAESAHQSGDYATARATFLEYVALHPDGRSADVAHYRAAVGAFSLGRYADAVPEFRGLVGTDSPLADRASFLVGLSSYRMGDFIGADEQWEDGARKILDDGVAAHAQFGRAWCAVRRRDWPAAIGAIDRMELVFPDEKITSRGLALRVDLRGVRFMSHRSPRKAKWLSSVLPGSGQIYAGRHGNGVVSAMINGVFIYFTGKAAVDRRWIDLGFLYLLGSRFYWGGRQNAEAFARQHNDRAANDFIIGLARHEM